MALLKGQFSGTRGVALKNAFYVRTWRGRLVVCKWPRGKAGNIDPGTRQRMADFKFANLLAKWVIPQQQIVAREATKGTPLLPRDLLIAAMYGRLWAITMEDGRTIYSTASARDVSTNLDLIDMARPVAPPPPPPPPIALLEVDVSRLTKSGSDLLLSPLNGNALPIDGTNETVPSAGVTLAPAGLTINTDHLIYAFMSGATMTLEASTTGHATDAATGIEIKAGDSTRTLVGMARPITGPAWADSDTQRFVLSWFNRRTIVSRKLGAASKSTSSTVLPPIEISTDHRTEFLSWDDDMPNIAVTGMMFQDTANKWFEGVASLDVLPVAGESRQDKASAFKQSLISSIGSPVSLTEGYHYATLLAAVQAGTATYEFIATIVRIKG